MPARTRVNEHTKEVINRRIQDEIQCRAQYYQNHPERVDDRLKELDREWDIERALEVNASALSLFGLLMGMTVSRRWLVLPVAVQAFLMQHGIQGWCPPLPLLRRNGFRTPEEIATERAALEAIEGELGGRARADGGQMEFPRPEAEPAVVAP